MLLTLRTRHVFSYLRQRLETKEILSKQKKKKEAKYISKITEKHNKWKPPKNIHLLWFYQYILASIFMYLMEIKVSTIRKFIDNESICYWKLHLDEHIISWIKSTTKLTKNWYSTNITGINQNTVLHLHFNGKTNLSHMLTDLHVLRDSKICTKTMDE